MIVHVHVGIDNNYQIKMQLWVGCNPPPVSMSGGLVFALGALVCSAINDIVFKKAVSAGVSVGWFACLIGTTWGIVQV